MKRYPLSALLGAALLGGAFAGGLSLPAQAADAELDLEIFLVEDAASPAEVVNRIELPAATAVALPVPAEPDASGPTSEATDDVQSAAASAVDTAAQSLTETINDAISIGDVENLPAQVEELVPAEVIDEIVDAVDTDLIDDLTDGNLNAGGALPEEIPGEATLDAAIQALPSLENSPDLDAALDQLEVPASLEDVTAPVDAVPVPEAPPVPEALEQVEENLEQEPAGLLQDVIE